MLFFARASPVHAVLRQKRSSAPSRWRQRHACSSAQARKDAPLMQTSATPAATPQPPVLFFCGFCLCPRHQEVSFFDAVPVFQLARVLHLPAQHVTRLLAVHCHTPICAPMLRRGTRAADARRVFTRGVYACFARRLCAVCCPLPPRRQRVHGVRAAARLRAAQDSRALVTW